jgi:hypothetical protein
LSKMNRAGEIERAGRGKYALPGQSGQKDRTDSQSIEPITKIGDANNLSDLSEGR